MAPTSSRRSRGRADSPTIERIEAGTNLPAITPGRSACDARDASKARSQCTRRSTSRAVSPRRQATRTSFCLLLLTLLALILCPLALASEGDRSPEYRMCVSSCTADLCRDHVDDGIMFAHRLPFILRLTRWTCEDDCKYHCTHRITNDAVSRVQRIQHDAIAEVETLSKENPISPAAKSERVKALVQTQLAIVRPVQKQMVQFHGKWVFVRFLGAQEPLSVVFSLLNLRVHYKALFMMRKRLPDAFPLKLVYIVHTLISINAWFWSAIFHTRDKDWTEKLDYFSAGSVIMSAFFFSACRLFRLVPGGERFVMLRRVCLGALGLHVLYLSVGRFDYAYNIAANVVVGLVHTLLWLTYSLRPTTFPSNPLVDRTAYSRAAMRAAKPNLSALSTPNPLSNGSATPPVPVSTNIGSPGSHTKQRRRLQLLLALMSGSVLLELLDFPPVLRILDAHALWHLATVPITQMWYEWLVNDAQECVSTGWWLSDRTGASAHGGEQLSSMLEQISEKLKGRAASLAQNMELNALTTKLNELANKAGFGGNASAAEVNGVGGSAAAVDEDGLGLGIGKSGSGATSTSIWVGAGGYSSLTGRDGAGSSGSAGKAKNY
ncbi:hypothetical protein NDA13_006528 [Ustilago tritici]|nr:hypothetical protein NDA13_006528 [Ustilago tritici]